MVEHPGISNRVELKSRQGKLNIGHWKCSLEVVQWLNDSGHKAVGKF